jgi:predicted transposase YdaD
MLRDILRETPAYQEILEEGREEGIEKGLAKGREQERQQRLVVEHLLDRARQRSYRRVGKCPSSK